MTPQVAAKLKPHEDEPSIQLVPSGLEDAMEGVASWDRIELGPAEIEGRTSASIAWREALHRRLLCAADVLSVALAVVSVLLLFDQQRLAEAALGAALLVVILFKAAGLYDRDDLRLVHSTLDEVPLLVQLSGVFALAIAVFQMTALAGRLNAAQIVVLWLASFVALLVGRVLARAVAGRTSPSERCLIIGEIDHVERIREKLASSRARASVVASLPLPAGDLHAGDGAAPALISRIVRNLRVHRIIIAPATADSCDVVDLIRIAKAAGVRVSLLPRMFEVVGSAVEFDDVDGMTMLAVRRFGLSRSSRTLKRTFDVVITGVGMLVVGPVMLLIGLAIRLDSRGPILFKQVRVGRDGSRFWIFKFRSMVTDAEAMKDELWALNEAGCGLFKIAEDPRVTRVGRFLRRTSLDELPQLLNVLRGEMSLVGPRPLVVDEDAQVLGLDRSRLHLTPGMTGPWQIMGSRVPMAEMVGIDYLYVANWSLWLDLKVMLRTAGHVVRAGNI
jgi:exopolysaccharide biosynthesis polyprenyl glycosylphosphotransferase